LGAEALLQIVVAGLVPAIRVLSAVNIVGLAPSVIARSEATKQSIYPRAERWIASLRSQ
jgi:hypothetical protein